MITRPRRKGGSLARARAAAGSSSQTGERPREANRLAGRLKSSSSPDVQQSLAAAAKAEDWPTALRLASELGDEEKMVRYALLAAFGRIPTGLDRMGPARAAQHLASSGHHAHALPLFEYVRDYLNAGRSASAAGLPAQAARHYEKAGEWLEAVLCYQALGRSSEAMRAVDHGERALEAAGTSSRSRSIIQLAELRLKRAELLVQMNQKAAAANVLRTLPPTVRRAELLEQAGYATEAVQSYLEVGATDKAHRLSERSPNRERLLAEVHLKSGRPIEAGHLFAKLGLAREAAEAYEAGQQWGHAAYRWEAANEPRRAAEAYEKAGQPSNAARCWTALGQSSRAIEAYVRDGNITAAADLHVRAGRLLEAASLYLSKGDKGKAAPILMRIQPGHPSFGMGTLLLAPLLIDEGFAADAFERIRQIPEGTPELELPQIRLDRTYWEARALEAMGRENEAAERYAAMAGADPTHRDTRERLARLRPPAPQEVAPAPAASTPSSGTAPAAEEVVAVGSRIAGRYDILAELGRGGMGRVFKARDLELGELVAIKGLVGVVEGGFGEEARLLKEIQICRKISHPNVVRVYDLLRFGKGIFLTMEYLEGRQLDQFVVDESPLPFSRIRGLIAEIASGLREAHDLGVVHRDLKPGNIFITASRLKILDFGIAAVTTGVQARLTQAGFVMGSPMYMSPEQVLGHPLDGRSDLYSVGLLAYGMITCREPYDPVEPRVLFRKKLREPPPDPRAIRPETPEPWAALLSKLLAKKPDQRFQSAQELLAALDELPGE